MTTQDLWKRYFVETAKEAGKKPDGRTDENGDPPQEAYSLYRAFYREHQDYERLDSDLIRACFREKELFFTPNTPEALERAINARFGGTANAYIESRPLLNDAQRKAIQNGLVQPVTLVQGPPGTGKTEMILNFLAVVTRLSPDSTAAVVSCNSEALNNITASLAAMKEQALRERAADDSMVKVSDRCAILGSKEKRREWSLRVERKLISDMDTCAFKRGLLERYPIFTSTIHSLPNLFGREAPFDYVIIDECSQVSVSLGLIAMAYARHLMLVGDNLQLQAIISREALKKAEELSDEALDKRIYFEKDGRSFLKACETLFPEAPGVLLNQHYRCHPSIANFCNEYVYAPYDSRLEVKTHTPGDELDD